MSRRPDLLEARARELAMVAGVDPDGRVAKAGSERGMPAWCLYRDAARAEQVAHEQEAAKAQIASLRLQGDEYKDSPLLVMGDHDQATIEQMRNCMKVGNVVAGVICADGHLGYAQPVGGVVAYEKQISISGVGFDIGCFTGDTRIFTLNTEDARIFTLNGQTPTLAEKEGQSVWILACDATGKPVPAQGFCARTRRVANLMRVTLDNGKAIRCTPDHLFMLRDGNYHRADSLTPGQSLMSLYMPERTCPRKTDHDSVLVTMCDNHKVVSVEAIPEREDVFCLSVPGLNNFGLADGVFVHNCGNMASRLDVRFDELKGRIPDLVDDIRKVVSFGVGRQNVEKVDHELFDDIDAWKAADIEDYRAKAMGQLGTVGSGNHYVDLFHDEDGYVWIGVHFGSRGLGHTAATKYIKAAGGKEGVHVAPAVVDVDGEIGQRYLAAMNLAGRYAYAGREWVVERVRKIIGGEVTSSVHNNHNYLWPESHNGRDLLVVRKGATPAWPGQRGFIGGSMGDDAVIIEGVESEQARQSLYSTVHGAGRVHGRMEAKRRFTRHQMNEWLQKRGVYVVGGDLDESPMAYRRLPDVLAHHAESIRVIHSLRPFAVMMAGADTIDPWKD